MLTAFARCWRAALTPTLAGLTSSDMSRSPPAFRAVTVPLSPAPDANATPMGISFGPVGNAEAASRTLGVVDSGDGAGATAGFDFAPIPDDDGVTAVGLLGF